MVQNILNGVVVNAALSGSLAGIIWTIDRFVNNYGPLSLNINSDKNITVTGGESLLTELSNNKIYIPSACGGRGSCGFCKCQVLDGGGPLLPTEKPYLSEKEIKDNVRLACQVKLRNNISIKIPEEIFNVKEFIGQVTRCEQLAPRIKLVTIDLNDEISFKAGQYVQFKAPKYRTEVKVSDEEVYRAYSIASGPDSKTSIELIITYIPQGAASTYVHYVLKEGDKTEFTGPFGDFYIKDSEKEVLMICIGSGLAPMLSILDYLVSKDSERKITLIFGARCKEDLILDDKLQGYKKKLKDFTYVPTLSRPLKDDNWTGEEGRVTDVIEKIVQQGFKGECYLCGSPQMIEASIEKLKRKGVVVENIFFDSFN
jgi:Na+-transporting NADH:ubiquinone oxidoreductase subunit F